MSNRKQRRRGPGNRRANGLFAHRPGLTAEALERRVLLTVSGGTAAQIDPGLAQQTLFAPDVSQISVQRNGAGVGVSYYAFTVDSADPLNARFTSAPFGVAVGLDAALALYDGDGNLVASSDQDRIPGQAARETLAAQLAPEQTYILGVYFESFLPGARELQVGAELSPQNVNDPVQIDAAAGVASRSADTGEDAFSSARDVDYYPLNFLNGGASGTVTLTGTAPDVRLKATLWRLDPQTGDLASALPGDRSWQQVATGAGETISLVAPAAADRSLTDSQYLLAVAPLDFTSPARSYQIDVAAPVLAPPQIAPGSGMGLGILGPVSLGLAQAAVNTDLAPNDAVAYSFTAPSSGPVSIALNSAAFPGLLGVYEDSTDGLLRSAATRRSPGRVEITIDNAVAGASYSVYLASITGVGGAYTLQISQAYTPTPATLAGNALTVGPIAVGAGGGQFFRISLPAGTDILSLQASSNGTEAAPSLTLVGPGILTPLTRSGNSGGSIDAYLDARRFGREVDILIRSGADGLGPTGTITLDLTAASVPATLPLAATPTAQLDLQSGDLAFAAAADSPGALAARKFYVFKTDAPTEFTAAGDSAARAAVAQYVEADGVLRLVNFALPGDDGAAHLTATLLPERFAAAAAIVLRPAAGENVNALVNGALPRGNGIAMVPEPTPQLSPSDPPPVGPPSSNLRLRQVKLRSPEQRDLWETLLPANPLAGAPTLRIGPAQAGGSLALNLTVLDDANNILATFTTAPGQVLTQSLDQLPLPDFAGRRIRFLVEGVAGQPLGDGVYTLELSTLTTNPTPFQVLEPSFNVAYNGAGTNSLPVGEPIRPLAVGGAGAVGSFTSSNPYNASASGDTGSIDVWRFEHGATPFEVFTQAVDPNSGVNTNIKLYRGFVPGGLFGLTRLDEIPGFGPNFDYFPADRSQVDAKIVVNNIDAISSAFPAGYITNTWFAVVKNEQGTQGQYRIKVQDVPPQQGGPAAPPAGAIGAGAPKIWIDPRTGVSNSANFVQTFGFVRFVTPSSLVGQPVITANANSAGSRTIQMDVLDADSGALVSRQLLSTNQGGVFSTTGLLPSRGYLIRAAIFGAPTTLNISVSAPVSTSNAARKPGPQGLTDIGTYRVPSDAIIERALQAPDGTFQDSTRNLGSGLQEKLIFWASTPGVATFTVSTGNLKDQIVALYRGEKSGGEFGSAFGTLVDFTITPVSTSVFTFQAYVVPGMYFLTVQGNISSPILRTTQVNVSGDLPSAPSQVITLDPNSGSTAATNLHTVDGPQFLLPPDPYQADYVGFEEYRTTFYKVAAPGAVRSGLTISATTPVHPAGANIGQANVRIYKQSGDGFSSTLGGDNQIDLDPADPQEPDDPAAVLTSADTALPGDVYFISLNRNRLFTGESHVQITAQFDVPQSGTPDVVVEPLRLEPANGQTLVTVRLRNNGYATAGVFRSRLIFSNYPTESFLTIPGLGPFATQIYTFLWTPTNTGDRVTYIADSTNAIDERNELNNRADIALNKQRPTLTLALNDPALDGNPAAAIWGRYVSSVEGANFRVVADPSDADGESDIYRTSVNVPSYGTFNFDGGGVFSTGQLDFARLAPTSAQNPNLVRYSVTDVWGLRSDEKTITVEVVAKPKFYTSIAYNPATHRYDLGWVHNLINYDKTVSQILGFSVPIVGDKRNQFFIGFSAQSSASLNSTEPVSLPLMAGINLTAFDKEIYKKQWTGATPITDTFSVRTSLEVSPKSLDVNAAAASFQLRNLQLFNIRTPKIPLFAYGIPGVAAISANFSFGLSAALSAGLKIGIDPNILVDPFSAPSRIGLMSPTFVQPSITGTAYVSGDVEVFGFDIASIEGSIGLTLNVAVGLDNADRSAVIPFDELLDRLAVKATGSLNFGISASVIIIGEIWSYSDSIPFNLFDTSTHGGIITTEPGIDPGVAGLTDLGQLMAGQVPASVLARIGEGQPTVRRGSDPVGPYKLLPAPQIVIDPATGDGLSVQTIDQDPADDNTLAGLVFTHRQGGVWSDLAPLADANDVGNPLLAHSHDGAGVPAVLVYEKVDLAARPAEQIFNDRLNARNLKYRYWDGANFGAEQSLSDLDGSDSDASIAFNAAGQGVAAWIHNTSATPLSEAGVYADGAQEIYAAQWDAATHTWLSGVPLTADAVRDTQPATFVDDAGKLYVVWIRDTEDGGNELAYSTNDGGGWTPMAALPIAGLEPGGKFTSVALGSETPGRVDVLFNYRRPLPDRSLDSKLYNRPSTTAAFAAPATVEAIADQTNFSHLRTLNAPDGSLVATWQQSDGVTNDIFASVLRPAGDAPTAWTEPGRLTSSTIIEQRPAVAIDSDGSYRVLYEIAGNAGPANPAIVVEGDIPTVPGVGEAVASASADFSFDQPLQFENQSLNAVGIDAQGQATIINRGLKADNVTIEYLFGPAGQETLLRSETVRLSPGNTYLAQSNFPVAEGENRFVIRLTAANGEIDGGADNISVYTLNGAPDLELTTFAPANPNLPPSADNPLQAFVHNRSTTAVGGFDVAFYSGDPLFPQTSPTLLGTVHIDGMFPGDIIPVSLPVDQPLAPGQYLYSAVVDSDGVILEATEGNNRGTYTLRLLTDPLIVSTADDGGPTVTATLLNNSGVDNVQVSATLSNAGQTASAPGAARLLRSLDDGEFIDEGTIDVPALAPGEQFVVTFTTDGLAGTNRYRVVFEAAAVTDVDLTNNVGEVGLALVGLADLAIASAPVLSNAAPSQGTSVTLTVDVSNLGIAGAENVLVEVIAIPASGGSAITLASVRIAKLAALSTQQVQLTIDTSALLGEYDLAAAVDQSEEVLEVDDGNNLSPTVHINVQPPAAGAVVGRYVFYNGSAFDGGAAGANDADDGAIAPDKSAVLPGGAATAASITTYRRGLNGIMLDIAGLPAGVELTADDFLFRTGRTANLATWGDGPLPVSVSIRRGAGAGGSDRVTLIWRDFAASADPATVAVANGYLEITLKAGARSGLALPDVFYFGNLIGDTVNSDTNLVVTASDLVRVRNAVGTLAPITSRFDFDRNGVVAAADLVLVRNAVGRSIPVINTGAGVVANNRNRPLGVFSQERIVGFSAPRNREVEHILA